MSKPEFSSTITLGNLLTLVAMLAAGFIAWGQRERDVSYLQAADKRHDEEIQRTDERVRGMEKTEERILERLDAIRLTLERLEKRSSP